jgi:mannose-6-phosphate isomerase-like protein (cupin superfamily)
LKYISSFLIFAGLAWAASSHVDIYTVKDIQNRANQLASEKKPFASADLARYGNHYTMLAYREATGSSELHEHEADIFVVENGDATLLTGGNVVNPKTIKPGEIRGTSITGGERHSISTGDIVHIPAGVPHQVLLEKGKPFTYFVVKVTGQ